MSQSPSGPRRGGLLLVLLGTVFFIALLIFGTGMASLLTGTDVIEVAGFGQIPGVTGVVLATLAFVAALLPPVRRGSPQYRIALWAAVGCYLAYLFGVFVAGVLSGNDPALAASIVGRLATFWYGPLVALAAAAAAAGVVAVTQSREEGMQDPRWPWEHRDE